MDRVTQCLGEVLQPCSTAPLTGFYRDGCCNTGPEDRGSIRLGQAGLSAHFRPSRSRALARTSLRMTAVIASLGALPLSSSCWYLRFRSALKRIATRAGMKIAARRLARPPRIISFPFHLPDWRVNGASPARLAACFGSRVPSSGISISSMQAVTALDARDGGQDVETLGQGGVCRDQGGDGFVDLALLLDDRQPCLGLAPDQG